MSFSGRTPLPNEQMFNVYWTVLGGRQGPFGPLTRDDADWHAWDIGGFEGVSDVDIVEAERSDGR